MDDVGTGNIAVASVRGVGLLAGMFIEESMTPSSISDQDVACKVLSVTEDSIWDFNCEETEKREHKLNILLEGKISRT